MRGCVSFASLRSFLFSVVRPHGLRRGLHSFAAAWYAPWRRLRGCFQHVPHTHNVYVQPPRVLGPPGVHTSGVTMLNSHAARLKRFTIICAMRSAAWPSHRGILAGSGGFNPSEVEFRILSTGTVYPAWAVTSDVSCSGRAINLCRVDNRPVERVGESGGEGCSQEIDIKLQIAGGIESVYGQGSECAIPVERRRWGGWEIRLGPRLRDRPETNGGRVRRRERRGRPSRAGSIGRRRGFSREGREYRKRCGCGMRIGVQWREVQYRPRSP